MKKVRSTWTDSRLDDLNDRVSDLGRRISDLDVRLTGRIDALQNTMIQIGGGLIATMVGLIITQI
jgi:hypothetical protein